MEIKDSSSPPLLFSQWKGYSSIEDIDQFIKAVAAQPAFLNQICYISLPTPLLRQFSKRTIPAGIILGAKSMESVVEGSFSEPIAIPLLKRANAKFVQVGSFESRHVLKETDESINKKVQKLLEADLQPVLCVGETLEQHLQGQTVKVIGEQLSKGLKNIPVQDQAKVIILYDAIPMQMGAKKYSAADCQMAYDLFREAVQESIPEVILPSIRLMYTFPEEFIDYEALLIENPGVGFYSPSNNSYIPLLENMAKIERPLTSKPFSKKSKPDKDSADFEEKEFETTAEETNSFTQQRTESIAKPLTESILEEDNEEETEESKLSKHSTVYSLNLTEPLLEEPSVDDVLEMSSESSETSDVDLSDKNDGTPPSPRSQSDNISRSQEDDENTENLKTTPALKKDAKKTSDDHFDTEDISTPLQDESLLEIPEENQAEKLIKPSSSQTPVPSETLIQDEEEDDFATRIANLLRNETELNEAYQTMIDKAEKMHKLRANYPILLEKVSHELNLLDPELQGYISQGNLEFFKQHPELFESARTTFEHVQNLNELIVEAGAIPREIDRLKSKAKKIREKLQNDWDFLNAHRLEVKSMEPEITFPLQPKVLQTPPPQIDLTLPAVQGPSPLLKKRIGLVKRDKKASS